MKSDCEIAYPPETSIQDDDREEFLDLLSQSASKHALDFLARCLMRSSARILMELLNHDPYAKGQPSERWEERLRGFLSVVPFTIGCGALIGGALGAGGGALIGKQLQGHKEVQQQHQEEINRQSSEVKR
jgi:hypothetical protein